MNDERQPRDPQTHLIIGAAMAVHRELGAGFLENVYSHALGIEFEMRRVPYDREVAVPVYYRGCQLPCTYRLDMVCFGDIIVELKAIERLSGKEKAQVINYLKATGLSRALLLNFGASRLEYSRHILSAHLRSSAPSVDHGAEADTRES